MPKCIKAAEWRARSPKSGFRALVSECWTTKDGSRITRITLPSPVTSDEVTLIGESDPPQPWHRVILTALARAITGRR